MSLKIAYLVQAHDNYEHLQKLIYALDEPYSEFYIHIDKKSAMPSFKAANIFFISERQNIHWGGFSQVRATLLLLQTAVKSNCDYYAFISGADYPVKSNSFLHNLLKNGGEYIHIEEGVNTYNPLSRYKYYYFTDRYNRRDKKSLKAIIFLKAEKLLRSLRFKKKIAFNIFVGAQWFVLSKACVDYILTQVETDKRYIQFFKSAFCPDESFFQTIIGNSPFYQQVRGYLTYTDWSVDPGPALINENHLSVLKQLNDKFFARKFNDQSADIIDKIDKELRADLS
ncbi:MAG TPA: beta-1,6-N-acetylglucosaminyltransferase [Panacibacter sp.]|nr:beta-1,6-N-acetylglucosaminyltransferase [Panacibacter sp.]